MYREYIYLYLCMCVSVSVRKCMYVYIRTHTHIHAYTHILCTHICMCVHTHTHNRCCWEYEDTFCCELSSPPLSPPPQPKPGRYGYSKAGRRCGRPLADNFIFFIFIFTRTVYWAQVGWSSDGGFVRGLGTDFAHGFLGLSLCCSCRVPRCCLFREGLKDMYR
jgi:hypothetical protein